MPGILEKLLVAGVLNPAQLPLIKNAQQQSAAPVAEIICQLGLASTQVVQQVLYASEELDLEQIAPSPAALELIDVEFARRWQLLPLAVEGDSLQIACSKPQDLLLIDQVRATTAMRYQIKAHYADVASIMRAIDQYYGQELAIDKILPELSNHEATAQAAGNDFHHPIIRLTLAILHDALRLRASDIHIEPEQQFMRLRYRIDGVLRQAEALPLAAYNALVVRIKVLANLDIANSKILQDGNFSLTLAGRNLDFRVAIMPTQYGENMVLRILDNQLAIMDFVTMGLSATQQKLLAQIMARPAGLTLITGPTGSGKTTTLYSILNKLNSHEVNIMTLEDPIEYKMPMLRQTALNQNLNIDFESGVRAILRQDPDIILIGEIRDAATATMALRAALTGHQVYSTLHCQSALEAFARLTDMGVALQSIAANLTGVIAQRLLRKLCESCKHTYMASESECAKLKVKNANLYRASGCKKCAHTGFAGRFCIMEILYFDTKLALLQQQAAPTVDLYQYASDNGFISLQATGIEAVLAGKTSLAELCRVVDMDRDYANL